VQPRWPAPERSTPDRSTRIFRQRWAQPTERGARRSPRRETRRSRRSSHHAAGTSTAPRSPPTGAAAQPSDGSSVPNPDRPVGNHSGVVKNPTQPERSTCDAHVIYCKRGQLRCVLRRGVSNVGHRQGPCASGRDKATCTIAFGKQGPTGSSVPQGTARGHQRA